MNSLSRRVFVACGGAAALARGANAQAPFELRAAAMPLAADDARATRVGALEWRGGFDLMSEHRRFGGFSDLVVSADGRIATLISDRGGWAELSLARDATGALTQVSAQRIGPLADLAGAPVRAPMDDAEGLARLRDGSLAVSFEQRHRIWIYPPGETPFARRPRILAAPPGIEAAPRNGALESLAALADGRLVTIAEDLVQARAHAAWIYDGRAWARAGYRAEDGFQPSGACALPNGDLLVLERAVGFLRGWRARIVRVPADAIRVGAVWSGAELARLDARHAIDNYEGIAAVELGGETLIHLISDDNFLRWQRTLLVCFALK